MIVRYDDGDVVSMGCPEGRHHDSLLSYKTHDALKRFAAKLFAPAAVGMGAKEDA